MKKLKVENFNIEDKLKYDCTELSMLSLKINKENLELTDEFKKDINDAIKSKDPREFEKITKNYGQFIPTEIILGGRVYTDETDNLKIGNDYNNSSIKSKFYRFNHIKILGGNHPDDENFNLKSWISSLEDYHNWDCVEFKDPVSIFQFLPDELRKECIKYISLSE